MSWRNQWSQLSSLYLEQSHPARTGDFNSLSLLWISRSGCSIDCTCSARRWNYPNSRMLRYTTTCLRLTSHLKRFIVKCLVITLLSTTARSIVIIWWHTCLMCNRLKFTLLNRFVQVIIGYQDHDMVLLTMTTKYWVFVCYNVLLRNSFNSQAPEWQNTAGGY